MKYSIPPFEEKTLSDLLASVIKNVISNSEQKEQLQGFL